MADFINQSDQTVKLKPIFVPREFEYNQCHQSAMHMKIYKYFRCALTEPMAYTLIPWLYISTLPAFNQYSLMVFF